MSFVLLENKISLWTFFVPKLIKNVVTRLQREREQEHERALLLDRLIWEKQAKLDTPISMGLF